METALSIIFYILISGISAYGAHMAQKKDDRRWLLLPILLFGLVAGLRASTVGTDTAANIRAFYSCLRDGNKFVTKEYLYYQFAALLLRIWENENFVLTVYGLIIYSLMMLRLWDFRKTTSLWLAVFLYGLFWFGGSLNGLRQHIAIAIIFYATRYLEKERYLPYILLALLATCFHISAAVSLLFILIHIGIRPEYTKIQAILGIGGLVCIIPLGIWGCVAYSNYLSSIELKLGLINTVRLALLLGAFGLFYRDAAEHQRTLRGGVAEAMPVKQVFQAALLGALIGYASFFVEFASRVGYYFRIFEVVFYGQLFYSRKKQDWKLYLLIAGLTVLGIYYLYRYNDLIPYRLAF